MEDDEFEQMRSPMVSSANGWTLEAPSAAVRGYFWVISPGFPEDPAMVHFWGGLIRHYGDPNSSPVSEMKGCLWSGPVPAPKPPEFNPNAVDLTAKDASFEEWVGRASGMTADPFTGDDIEHCGITEAEPER